MSLILLFVTAVPTQTLRFNEARERLWAEGRTAAHVPPTAAVRRAVTTLLPQMVERARRGESTLVDLQPLAAAAHLVLERWKVVGTTLLVLREAPGTVRGTGAYLVRVGPDDGPPILLQSPHAYHDRHTGRIGLSLFLAKGAWRRPRAFFTNTVQRYVRGPERRNHPADVCHAPEHVFTDATVAVARALPGLEVIQLHGFEITRRRQGTIVVSASQAMATPRAREVAGRLRAAWPDVRLFPDDTAALGALENRQARALRALPGVGFLHIEVVRDLRDQLRKTRALRHRLATALFGASGLP